MKKSKKGKRGEPTTPKGYGYSSQGKHDSFPEESEFKQKLKSLFEKFDSATSPHMKYMMEKLNPWVAFKRFLNVLDNIFAAGLFSFFVAWTANYLGHNAELDLGSSISKSLTEIVPHSLTDTLYLLLYLCAFWRTIRVTKVMPFNQYVDKYILLIVAMAFIAGFALSGGCLYVSEKRLMVLFGYTEEEAKLSDDPFYVMGLRWGVGVALFTYRRVILRHQISEWYYRRNEKREQKGIWE